MKKKILLILLVVGLLAIGSASAVYAIGEHNPVKGNKLVGFGPLGQVDPTLKDSSHFSFINPDCVNDITIESVSITRPAMGGVLEVIYEGPYLQILPNGTRVPLTVLMPHRLFKIELWNWIPDGSGGWLTEDEARQLPIANYTVEIKWTAEKEALPPMGYGQRTTITAPPDKPAHIMSIYIPMENMKQK